MTAAVVACSLVATACGSSSSSSTGTARKSGPVTVLYAGSLVRLMEDGIGPGFDKATGYSFTGISGDSKALASEIKAKVHLADVFVSASPTVNTSLEGSANGDWVSWYAEFATSPLVIGYNPKSKFAQALKTQPWYRVVTRPGFLLGRTDPATDPKGKLAAQALTAAAAADNEPGLDQIVASTSNIFPENTLVGRLQAGQLDAGFFYSAEAKAAGIPTVAFTGQDLQAAYTVTVLNHPPDPAAADAFVTYLLGSGGGATLTADGFVRTNPAKGTGPVPAALQSAVSG